MKGPRTKNKSLHAPLLIHHLLGAGRILTCSALLMGEDLQKKKVCFDSGNKKKTLNDTLVEGLIGGSVHTKGSCFGWSGGRGVPYATAIML